MKPKKILGILGHKIDYSLSPLIHNTAAEHLGLDYYYTIFNIHSAESIPAAIEGMRALGIAGFNVTIPYKERVVKYLDQLAPSASVVQAVNTIVNQDGLLIGYNTDVEGFAEPLLPFQAQLKHQSVAIFGNGGAARATVEALKNLFEPSSIHLIVRNMRKGEELKQDLVRRSMYLKISVHETDEPATLELLKTCRLIVNATPIGTVYANAEPGTKSEPLLPGSSYIWNDQHIAYDLVYSPPMTAFLEDAKNHGATVISGIDMLIGQAARAFQLWTGKDMPLDIVKAAVMKKIAASSD
ncbi:shikimate 5-dehydrogenase [Chloroherpeton thalassium ATCC 35110]|uniref:Shikimate dehydrogenase (NADP(+)) n=1 Tax=Chloroherpeton thalassium (strain ATCC 35110 / GB-78) TaxID=517418 RepID=B3QSM0_CHLT3|nr:shikimate dehydrogenase [Chloroherpeton thalassium]ACF14067.1 shikimate 5-dehydrogenase [Chloroherpeton thalassium ATCC 35110]